jgi:hypothetical protein
VWAAASLPVLSVDAKTCTRSEVGRAVVPAGMPGRAWVDPTCGGVVVLAIQTLESGGTTLFNVDPAGLSLAAPKVTYDKPSGAGFAAGMVGSMVPAVALDGPSAGKEAVLLPGEPVDVLWRSTRVHPTTTFDGQGHRLSDFGRAVVRARSGRTFVVAAGGVLERDYLAERSGQARRLVDQYAAAVSRWDGDGVVERYRPGATGLVALWVQREYLGVAEHRDEWLDPVGQLYDRPCDERTTSGCGQLWLDWAPLGAHRPADRSVLVGVVDGSKKVGGRDVPRLRVLVRDATTDRLGLAQ